MVVEYPNISNLSRFPKCDVKNSKKRRERKVKTIQNDKIRLEELNRIIGHRRREKHEGISIKHSRKSRKMRIKSVEKCLKNAKNIPL